MLKTSQNRLFIGDNSLNWDYELQILSTEQSLCPFLRGISGCTGSSNKIEEVAALSFSCPSASLHCSSLVGPSNIALYFLSIFQLRSYLGHRFIFWKAANRSAALQACGVQYNRTKHSHPPSHHDQKNPEFKMVLIIAREFSEESWPHKKGHLEK